jgi:nitrate reductase alpha subunit
MAADVAGRSGGLLADSRDAGRHGSGTNRWYHSGQIYRTLFTLIMLCGCERVNGGGWARVARRPDVCRLPGPGIAARLDPVVPGDWP